VLARRIERNLTDEVPLRLCGTDTDDSNGGWGWGSERAPGASSHAVATANSKLLESRMACKRRGSETRNGAGTCTV